MTPFLITLLLAVAPCTGDGHNQHRSRAAVQAFKNKHPCPGGPDQGSTGRCTGYVVDHICPLACCGKDLPSNMQWQTEAAGKAKDQWELDCARSCAHSRRVVPPTAKPCEAK